MQAGSASSCFYVVQGNKNTSASFVVDAAKKLIDLTVRCCGGEVSAYFTLSIPPIYPLNTSGIMSEPSAC